MNKHLQKQSCPVCCKALRSFYNGSWTKNYCMEFYFRDKVEWNEDVYASKADKWKIREFHYSITIQADESFYQSTIIPPYWIRSFSATGKSDIYKFPIKTVLPGDRSNILMTVPIIVPTDYTPEQFIRKIKNLVIFT